MTIVYCVVSPHTLIVFTARTIFISIANVENPRALYRGRNFHNPDWQWSSDRADAFLRAALQSYYDYFRPGVGGGFSGPGLLHFDLTFSLGLLFLAAMLCLVVVAGGIYARGGAARRGDGCGRDRPAAAAAAAGPAWRKPGRGGALEAGSATGARPDGRVDCGNGPAATEARTEEVRSPSPR